MEKWRYKTVVIRELALSDAKLNAEGEKGWELVSVCMTDGNTARAFFKQHWDVLPQEHAVVGFPEQHEHAEVHH